MASRHAHADLPIDQSVIIPAAVRAAGEAAEALQRQIFGGEAPPQPPVPGQPQTPPQVPPQPIAPPAPTNPNPDEFVPPPVIQEPQPQPVSPVPNQPEPTPPQPLHEQPIEEPPPAIAGTEEGKWERAYRSMKGRFDHLQSRSNTIIQGLNSRVAELEQIARAPQPPAPQSTPSPSSTLEGITDEDINTWGPDMVAFIDRVANIRVAKATGQVTQQIERVQTSVQQSARDRLIAHLNQEFPARAGNAAPYWYVVNRDQNFIAWLNLRDDMSGRIRNELLNDAFEANDAQRVAAFFKSFISEASPVPAAAPSTPAQTPAPVPVPAPPSNRMSLASLAAPGGARTAATPPTAPVEKRMWTNSSIANFYAAVNRGQYNGREAEMTALETDIFAAQAEGRVMEG